MIRKRNGSYIVEVWDPTKKRPRHVRPSDFGMETPVKRLKDAQRLERMATEAKLRHHEETCGSFAQRWTRDFPRSPQTNVHNAERLRRFIEDFGTVPLRGILPQEAERWAVENPGRIPAVISMFGDAKRRGYVETNPFAGLAPKGRGRKDLRPPTIEQVYDLAECARKVHGSYGNEFAAMILWGFYTLMRPGEIFTAKWTNLKTDTYFVEDQLNSTLGTITEPKHGSTGEVVVPSPVFDALLSVPRRLGDDLIFRTKTGKRFRQESHYRAWHPVRCMYGQPSLSFYLATRHAGASHMVNVLHVEPWLVGRQLRHSPEDAGRLVMSTYGHPDDQVSLSRIRSAFTTDRGVLSDASNTVVTTDRAPLARF